MPFARTLAALLICNSTAALAAEEPKTVAVWTASQDGYHTYRIPAVIVAPNGDLLAFCEGRRNNSSDHGDLDLLQKRSTDGGLTWSEQSVVYEEGGDAEVTIGNPCPVVDQSTGTIWMPFTRDNDDVFMTHSTDSGQSWSKPVMITDSVKRPEWGWYATGPGVGIQLQVGPHAGRLVIPCDHRTPEYDCGSHVIYSDDHGETWQLSSNVIQPGANECQVVELADGRLLLNARMQAKRVTGERGVSFSDDGGETWSELSQESGLADPVVQASLISVTSDAGDAWLLFSNPDVPQVVGRGARRNLTVQLSNDAGSSWSIKRPLHPGPAAYSCLVELPDGAIGCLYEAGERNAYETIAFARFSLEWLRE